MIFNTSVCPICLHNLEKDEKQDTVSYHCPNIKVAARNFLDTGVVHYPHYAHRAKITDDGKLIEASSEVSMLLPPYMLGHYAKTKETKICALYTDKPYKEIVVVPLLEKNYSQTHEIMQTLKTLVIFS